jgi:hypothetical protein
MTNTPCQSGLIAKVVCRFLFGALSGLLLSGQGNAQESAFESLIGGWNHLDTGQSIDVKRNGDVWQTSGPAARVAGTIESGANFAFEGVDNNHRQYRCSYYINFLDDGTTNWRNTVHTGSWACPSGRYARLAGALTAEPPNGFAFAGTQGGPFNPSDASVRLVADGNGLRWSMQSKGPDWLGVSPTQGDLAADGSGEVKLSLLPSAKTIAPGTYDATLTFRGAALGIVQRTLHLVVTEAPPSAAPAKDTATQPPAQQPPEIAADDLSEAQLGEAIHELDALLGPARGRVQIRVAGGNRVKIGGRFRFEAETLVQGRLVILDIDADRHVTLIYPNKYLAEDDIGRINVGRRVLIPADNYPGSLRSFQAVEPVGKGILLAFVAPEDFQVDRMVTSRSLRNRGFVPVGDGASYLLSFIYQIKTWLAQKESAGDELQRWAFGVTGYEIVR